MRDLDALLGSLVNIDRKSLIALYRWRGAANVERAFAAKRDRSERVSQARNIDHTRISDQRSAEGIR